MIINTLALSNFFGLLTAKYPAKLVVAAFFGFVS